MNRSPLMDRLGLRRKDHHQPRSVFAHLGMEQLEERRMLSVDNLLVSTLDDTGGSTVLEFNEASKLRLPGGAFTGDHGLGQAHGLAAAPDGSYYVSSNLVSGQVLHFSSAGSYLGVLGAGDAVQAPIYAPGALAFGPNGNLYVADMGAQAIYQFNLNVAGQQFVAAATLSLGFIPGGFTFAADGTQDLIVGDLNTQSVVRFHNSRPSTLVAPGSGINPAAILALSNGDLLIADMDMGYDPTGHHQIVRYDASTKVTSQFLNLTTPVSTGTSPGLPPQPTALMLDHDGNLLVGLSPDHNGNGAVLKFDINSKQLIATIASGIGTPTGLALVPVAASDILFSTYFDTKGSSVLRYNDATQLPVPGGAATSTGSLGLGQAAGLAVAPDGSYYVSSLLSGQVLHYSNAGALLNVLGQGDATHAPLYAPGTLAFGPDGNLYVAEFPVNEPSYGIDIPGAIYQFDTASSTQQYQAADSVWLPSGFTPGGFTFAADATRDLIVANLNTGEVRQFNADGTTTQLITPGTQDPNNPNPDIIVPIAMLELSDGRLLIADSILGSFQTGHHQILQYSAATGLSQFIDLTQPTDSAGDPPQPSSLALDTDGNLLVGLSPDDFAHGAVEKFSIQSGALLGTIATGVGEPSGLALIPSQASDMLVGDYDHSSVLRYSTAAQPLAQGGVAPGANSLGNTSGVAVAPDGSYYVSSLLSGQVLHYSSGGVFLNVLGQGDNTHAPLYAPGTLAFGPNGNLYVAEFPVDQPAYGLNIPGAIYQFDTTSGTQQYQDQPGATIWLPSGFTPGGFTFAADATRDLIVGNLNSGEVLQFHADGTTTQLIAAGTQDPNNPNPDIIVPIAMQELSDGTLLIADSILGSFQTGHHQILQYSAAAGLSQFIDLTVPVDSAGDLPQPTSLLLTADGNLLVGLSPDHSGDGAVEEFNLANGQLLSTKVSSIGTPTGLAFVPPSVMAVPAAAWGGTALTLARTSDGKLHVYGADGTTDVVSPQAADGVGAIQISGPDSAANTLTIAFGSGNPIPADGLFFQGASGAKSNTVIINDASPGDSYRLSGSQLFINDVPALTLANTQALHLDPVGGALDLTGSVQAIGSIWSDAFAVQSGTITANLTGPGELSKVGAGTATLSGSNGYQGGTAVTAGTLVVTSAAGLLAGSTLTVGEGGVFGSSTSAVVHPSAAFSSVSTVAVALPAVTGGVFLAAPAAGAKAAAPSQGGALTSDAAWAGQSSTAAPARVQSNSFSNGSRVRVAGSAAARAPRTTVYPAWWNGSAQSSAAGDSAAEKERRIAALDAVLTQYGSP